ncbi:MAG: AAA family ATPase [Candidatus Uhrbacteria bacterium]
MWLQRIEINGFKSFANAAAFEFTAPTATSQGITAIVGPNGSGKSCLVDAIRWVLGEQSMKLLRGKRAEDVIFAGTPRRPRLGVAEVTVHLDNTDNAVDIPYSEITIGRRVYRNSDSEYLLNGQRVRREDIVMLLARARIGQRTYSIIGQGMIDQFLLASPMERKEFFNEAAGIRPIEIKRDQAIAKLDRAKENLRQGEVLLAELTPRLRSLQRQVRRLERREDVERDLQALLTTHFGAQWHALREELERTTATWRTADTERKQLQTEVEKIQAELAALEHDERGNDGFLLLQREYEVLVNRRQELRERLLTLRSTAANKTTTATLPVITLVADLDDILAEFDEFLIALRRIDRLDDLRPTVERLTSIQRRITDIKNKYAPTTKEKAPELREAELALQAIETNLADVQERMRSLHETERQEKGKLFELQRRSRDAQLRLNDAVARVNDLRIELARLEQRREDLRLEMARDLGANTNADNIPKPTIPPPSDAPERIVRLQRELAAIGTLDDQTVTEHRETDERVRFLTQQTDDLRKSIAALERIITELGTTIERAFDESFATINTHFERYFRQLFGGGNAKLTMLREEPRDDDAGRAVNDDDESATNTEVPRISPTSRFQSHVSRLTSAVSGIDIQATPPGKRIKNIAMLSGGERALTAIALLCAIISASASPFVVLDEVDAALDEANSVRFAEILKDLARRTQFLVVTHNRYTMERASTIYGITMGDDGASKLLSLKLEEAATIAA